MKVNPAIVVSLVASPNPQTFSSSSQFTGTISYGTPSSTGVYTYMLDYGDGSTPMPFGTSTLCSSTSSSGCITTTHTYPSPTSSCGCFTATLTATDSTGVSQATTLTVVVNSGVKLTMTIYPNPQTAGTSSTYTVTITGAQPGSTYTLDYGDGKKVTGILSSVRSTFSTTHSYMFSGSVPVNYNVQLSVVSSGVTSSIGEVVTVDPPIGLTLSANPNPQTLGTASTFTGTISGGSGSYSTIILDYGDSTVDKCTSSCSSTVSFSHTYASFKTNPGFTATLTATDSTGAAKSVTLTVPVQNAPPPILPSGVQVEPICTSSGILNPATTIFGGATSSAQSMLTLTLLLILLMIIIIAALYMIGVSFDIRTLVEFGKVEMGEIIITAIIAFVFIGTFFLGSRAVSLSNLFAAGQPTFNNNLYVADCSLLAHQSISLIPTFFSFTYYQLAIQFLSSITLNLQPDFFGISIAPFAGFNILASTVFNYFADLTGGMIFLLLGATLILAIVYNFFPLFLYAGIVLRTLPWTRAAGGAFLGVFIAFYIMFPFLLFAFLVGYAQTFSIGGSLSCSSTNPTGACSPISEIATLINPFTLQTNPTAYATATVGLIQQIDPFICNGPGPVVCIGLIDGYIGKVLEPVFYTLISVILSFLIAFDFMEAVGDLLGAQNLQAGDVLRNVI